MRRGFGSVGHSDARVQSVAARSQMSGDQPVADPDATRQGDDVPPSAEAAAGEPTATADARTRIIEAVRDPLAVCVLALLLFEGLGLLALTRTDEPLIPLAFGFAGVLVVVIGVVATAWLRPEALRGRRPVRLGEAGPGPTMLRVSLEIPDLVSESWKAMTAVDGRIDIVTTTAAAGSFVIGQSAQTSRLPRNTPIIGLHEAIAVGDITRVLPEVLGKDRVETRMAAEYSLQARSVVSIGGPEVNRLTEKLIVGGEIPTGLVLERRDYDSRWTDTVSGEVYQPTIRDDVLVNDFGFIVVGPNPIAPEFTACVLWGVWPPGAAAAVRTLLALDGDTKQERDLAALIRQRRGVVAVVEVKLDGLSAGTPTVRAVRRRE